MAVRVIKKSLAGSEDLLLGFGTEVQVRNDKNIEITRINASNIPYDENTSIADNITKKVDTLADMIAMEELPVTVWCSGYHSKNDGAFGSHFYRLKGLKTTETDNSGTVIVVSVGGSDYVYELQYSGVVNVKWFGAVGDGVTDDTAAIQSSINNSASLFFAGGVYLITSVEMKSDSHIEGESNLSSIIQSIENTDMFVKTGTLKNVTFNNLKIDMKRTLASDNPYVHIFKMATSGSNQIDNITFENLILVDAQEDFIRIQSSHTKGVSNIKVSNCRFIGTLYNETSYPKNAIRTVCVDSSYNRYGEEIIKNVSIVWCYAEYIRTLADMKRNTHNINIDSNVTSNMFDCHHSLDGAFNANVVNNIGTMDEGFSYGSATNYLEVQGENILISGNNFTSKSSGQVTGILITDYGYPSEDGKGHNSRNISILGNKVENCTGIGIKAINTISGIIDSNTVISTGSHSISVDSGTARVDELGNKLTSSGMLVKYNKAYNCAYGANITGDNQFYGSTISDNSVDDYRIPSNSSVFLASPYYKFKNISTDLSLVDNRFLLLDSNSKVIGFSHAEGAEIAPTKPYSVPSALRLQDTSTTALREVTLSKRIPIKQNEKFYIRYWVKKGNLDYHSVIIKEKSASGTNLSTSFVGSGSPLEWTEVVANYKVTNALCEFLEIAICPAAAYNNPAATGYTDFADFRFSKKAIGEV